LKIRADDSVRRPPGRLARLRLVVPLVGSLLLLTGFVPAAPTAIRTPGELSSPDVSVRVAGTAQHDSASRFTTGLFGMVGRETGRAVAQQGDPEPGLDLIAAVYNSLQDRFFRPLDSSLLLEAAWEGARRALDQQRKLPRDIDDPALTGDRAADLDAFKTQYRALLAAAGPSADANLVAMIASDVMTDSIGEHHTYFLPPEQFARYVALLTTDSEGRIGLGIVIQGAQAPFRIGSVSPGAPAEQAGVQVGDEIASVDGRDVSRLRSQELLDLLRGDEGQPVTLSLRREGAPVELTVVRAKFKDAPLSMRVLPEGVCHFKLTSFPVMAAVGPTGRTIGGDFDYYLEQCEQAGGQGWIVDLRGNPGGNATGEVIGRFMNDGPIMVERDRLGGRYEQAPDGHLFRVQRPLVVLIDNDSASASEVMASAVQEHKRGIVMGQRSAGALNTTIVVRLPLGSGMGVAIREVFTGVNEVVIDGVGVNPDVTINLGRDPFAVPAEAIQAALNPDPSRGPTPEGPSPFEGMLSAAELQQRTTPLLLRPDDMARPEDRSLRYEYAYDSLNYYASESPQLAAGRERALRLGWQGSYLRSIGAAFPAPFASSVDFYRDQAGAHNDLREIYEPGEPRNPRQWRDVDVPVSLGDETVALVGTGQNEGRVWISWRRGSTVFSVAQTFLPGQPQPLDEVARLARIVDARARAAGS
jgi:carboxyl-terminal processing protease